MGLWGFVLMGIMRTDEILWRQEACTIPRLHTCTTAVEKKQDCQVMVINLPWLKGLAKWQKDTTYTQRFRIIGFQEDIITSKIFTKVLDYWVSRG